MCYIDKNEKGFICYKYFVVRGCQKKNNNNKYYL